MRAPSSSLLRLCTGFAVLLCPTLLGARGCELGESHEVCTTERAPVCGADGVTYGNACEATRAGVDIAYEGECETACYEIYAPVCGEDGMTYPNDCYARVAGVVIARVGVCECPPVLCDVYCEFGHAQDETGCGTCECNPPPLCEPVLCDLWCEHGFALDEAGCETCACNPPPSECASDADCGADEMCLVPLCPPVCLDEDGDGACDPCGPGFCAPRETERRCESDDECGDGGYCAIEGCAEYDCGGEPGADCGGPPVCFGVCRPLPPPSMECRTDADCIEGQVCIAPDIACDCVAEPCECPEPLGFCAWVGGEPEPAPEPDGV